jgi:hypothetical protein
VVAGLMEQMAEHDCDCANCVFPFTVLRLRRGTVPRERDVAGGAQ